MGSLSFGLTIKNYKAKSTDLENLMTMLSEEKILKSKNSSNDKEQIILEFKSEQEPLKNKKDASEKGSQEWKNIMAEMQELQDAKDDALKEIENEIQVYEEEIDLQLTSLQTQKEAIDADIDSMSSARDEDIKDENTYGEKV